MTHPTPQAPVFPDAQVEAVRISELIEICRRASTRATNIIDPPFDCVTVNLKPSTWAEMAAVLTAASQAAPVSGVAPGGWQMVPIELLERIKKHFQHGDPNDKRFEGMTADHIAELFADECKEASISGDKIYADLTTLLAAAPTPPSDGSNVPHSAKDNRNSESDRDAGQPSPSSPPDGDAPFQRGQLVIKEGGDYTFKGRVLVAFQKLKGAWRIDVENADGLIHTFNAKQLRLLDDEPPSSPATVHLKEGWLNRDVERAVQRINEWEGKAAPTPSQAGLVEELVKAANSVLEDIAIFTEQFSDSSVGPGTIPIEAREPPIPLETIDRLRTALEALKNGERG